jgi:hypothetical protein
MTSSLRPIKSIVLLLTALFVTSISKAQPLHQPEGPDNLTATIRHLDSLFWQAYNTCDVDKASTFFTEDVEFYHDKGGLTATRAALMEQMRTGLCGSEKWKLRREVVEGSVDVFPLNKYGAIISGEHVFYVLESGKKERLDGLAKFTHVWQYKDNEWKMSRVLSYDHKPAPYRNKRKEVLLSSYLLKQYAGRYESAKAGTVTVAPDGTLLKMDVGKSQSMLYAESETKFFSKERDLQFEFVRGEKNKVVKMIVYENGEFVEEAKRIR